MSIDVPIRLYLGEHTRTFTDLAQAQAAVANGWSETPDPVSSDAVSDDAFNPHVENTNAVKDHIDTLTDVADLDALRAAEEAHPSFEGGRAGVLKAIDDKKASLNA